MFNVINYLKKQRKRRLFNKCAVTGKELIISHDSFCSSKDPKNILIGDYCDLSGCRIYAIENGKVQIGDHTTIRYNSKISSVSRVVIGSHVIISNNVDIYDHNSHPVEPEVRWEMCESGFYGDLWSPTKAAHKDTIIEDNVWIGEKSVVLKGVTIGKGSIVASHTVVTKDVPPYSLVAGNPGRIVKKVARQSEEETY